jgi:predicted ATPase
VTADLWILTGAPGTGKTAVLDELRGDLRCVDEPARRVLARQRAAAGVGTPEQDASRFVDLLLELAIADHETASRQAGPTLFDRGIPDCIAYAVHLGVDPGPSVEASERHRCHDEVLVLEPSEAIYTRDDERTMSFDQTVTFHDELAAAYDRAGYRLIPVPYGTVQTRVAFVRHRIGTPFGAST